MKAINDKTDLVLYNEVKNDLHNKLSNELYFELYFDILEDLNIKVSMDLARGFFHCELN